MEGTRPWSGKLNGLRQAALDLTEPAARVGVHAYPCSNSRGEPDDVLVFEVPPGTAVPATRRDEVFLRVGDENRRLGFAQRRELLCDDVQLEGPIPRALAAARERVAAWQPVRRALGRRRVFEDLPLVPEDAWLEGIVNAAVHRSYSLGGDHLHVAVFDDRIEIESPGRFHGLVDVGDPLHTTRFARNSRIARVCADLALGRESGEGIRRMFEEMRLAGLGEPRYHQMSGTVQLTLSGEAVDRRLDGRLDREARAVTAALRESGQLSTGEVAELIGLARPTTIRRLQQLRSAGVLDWVGRPPRDPRAFWRRRR